MRGADFDAVFSAVMGEVRPDSEIVLAPAVAPGSGGRAQPALHRGGARRPDASGGPHVPPEPSNGRVGDLSSDDEEADVPDHEPDDELVDDTNGQSFERGDPKVPCSSTWKQSREPS